MPPEGSEETTPKGPVDAWGNQVLDLRKTGSVSISFNKGTEGFELRVEQAAIRPVLGVTLASYTATIFSQIVCKRT